MANRRARSPSKHQGVPIRRQDGLPYTLDVTAIATTVAASVSGSGSELPVDSVLATATSTNPQAGLGYGTWALYATVDSAGAFTFV